ncbi:gamma-secretase subunit Aph-1-like [Actinia tenebrosa]|uniref:Gamma-secretase subunit Aph-1-like n=1 Tax=Actinia tenebrosa TaxID=6105 RepID=A0A6P8HMC7_ACTTE|nr:gamma-secretase subunit Aph-1-like [Actinia tenebrosa]
MTLMVFFGCALIAFGPACAMFSITVAGDAQQVIVFITSAFFWLISLLISSIWWLVVSPLKEQIAFGMTFSVLFQELFRLAYYFLLRKADEGLVSMINNQSPLRKHRIAYVAGLGYGTMSGLFAMVNVLADITGPGSMGLRGDPQNFLIVSAFLTSCFVLLNTFWGVILFESFDKKKRWLNLGIVVFSHLFVSLMTLLNASGNYIATLISAYLVMIIMGVIAFNSAGGSCFNIYRLIMTKKSHVNNK